MAVTFTSLSASDAISFEYLNKRIDSDEYWFGSGLKFSSNGMISDSKDISLNNSNLLFLSKSSKPLKDIFLINGDETIYDRIQNVTVTPLHNVTLGTTTLSNTNFFLTFLGEDTVKIQNMSLQYLTVEGTLTGLSANPSINFAPSIEADANTRQTFRYFAFDEDKISIFTNINIWSDQRALQYLANEAMPFQLDATITESNPLQNKNIYRALRLNVSSGASLDFGDDIIVNKYSDSIYELSISDSEVLENSQYMVSIPYRDINVETDRVYYDANIHALKNFISPEGNSFKNSSRTYNKIITGQNEEIGLDSIHLAFNSSLKEYLFKSGHVTYFHYPLKNAVITLSNSNLIEKGAIAGHIPQYSDKVFKKNAQYKKFTFWGDDNTSTVKTGQLVCSWLYAETISDTPVWKDRFYIPNRNENVSLTSLLSEDYRNPFTITSDYNTSKNNFYILDADSTMTFEEGVLYAYHRLGKSDQTNFLSTVSSNIVKEYDEITTPIDATTSQSDALSIIGSKEFSVGFWMNYSKWKNPDGDQIFGNYHNGGFGIFLNNHIFNPYSSIYDNVNKKLINVNISKNKNLSEIFTYNSSDILQIIRLDYDKNYFVLYSDYNIIEYNQNNLIRNVIDLSTVTGSSLTSAKIEIDSDENIHVLKSNNDYYKLDKLGNILSSSLAISKVLMWVKDDNVAYFNTWAIDGNILASTVDSFGNIFYFTSTKKLYKNSTVLWNSIYGFLDIKCDADDNIHLLYDLSHYAILDTNGNVQNYRLIDGISREFGDMKLGFSEILIAGNRKSVKYIFDNLLKRVYEIRSESDSETENLESSQNFISDNEGKIITTNLGQYIQITQISISIGEIERTYEDLGIYDNVDIFESGYDWQRRFSKILDDNLSVRFYLRQTNLSDFDDLSDLIQCDVSDLTNGWHHVGVVFDTTHRNKLELYIDSVLKASYTIPVGYTIRNFENYPIFYVGKNSSTNNALWSILEDDETDWEFDSKMWIKDLVVYNKAFVDKEVFFIFNNKNQRSNSNTYFDDMIWDIELNNDRGFIETIDKHFLHSVPGHKSTLFDITINNFGDFSLPSTKNSIENVVNNLIDDYKPAHSEINSIIWENNV